MKAETPGAMIRRARHEAGLTQAELAEQLKVHKVTVGDWERGRFFPDRHWGALNKILHISLRPPGSQPAETPERDPLADYFGEEKAARLRRVLEKRGEAGATVLAELEREFSSPAAAAEDPGESGSSRAAS